MLAALLTNIPHGQSGQLFGSVTGQISHGTTWNKNWAQEYGPDVDRAKKAKRKDVQKAIKALREAPELEPIEEAQEIAKRSLAKDLAAGSADLITVMTAYYALKRWKKRKENEIATLLLLMN